MEERVSTVGLQGEYQKLINPNDVVWIPSKLILKRSGKILMIVRYVEPLPPGSKEKFEFENMIVGQAIPSGFIPAIEKGFKEAANS